jgi:hypothetical protein
VFQNLEIDGCIPKSLQTICSRACQSLNISAVQSARTSPRVGSKQSSSNAEPISHFGDHEIRFSARTDCKIKTLHAQSSVAMAYILRSWGAG